MSTARGPILIATGSTYRRLGVPGEDDLIGAGVHFCATCDGPFYKGQHVAVIGGGNSAGEESLFLTRFADKVTILVRGPEMTASKIVIDKVTSNPKIEVRYNVEVAELHGESKLSGITLRDRTTGATNMIDPAAAFVFIGLSPNSGWLPAEIQRDPTGFIITKRTWRHHCRECSQRAMCVWAAPSRPPAPWGKARQPH